LSIDLKEKLGTKVKKEEESKAGSGGGWDREEQIHHS
jgi:hypothetical protein